VREGSVGELVRNLARDARDNPLPLALIGAGIAWLMVANGRRSASVAASEAPGDAISRASDAASELAEETSERMSAAYRDATDAPDRVSEGTTAAGRGFLDYVRDEPLLLAGVGLALGAAIGAVLPSTRAEKRAMGDGSGAVKQPAPDFAAAEQADYAGS